MASLIIAFAIEAEYAISVPAVCSELIRTRAMLPKKAPIKISPIKSSDSSVTFDGIIGNVETNGGDTAKVTAMPIAKLKRGETNVELKPGSKDIAVPTRAKIRKKPKTLSESRSASIWHQPSVTIRSNKEMVNSVKFASM